MELHRPKPPAYEAVQEHGEQRTEQLPAFPRVPTGPFQSRPPTSTNPTCTSPKDAMNIDNLVSPRPRPQRASSVASGMSLEDMQAAETLEMLRNGTASPKTQVPTAAPQWVGLESEYRQDQEEPLLHLLTSQVPLLSSAVNGSLNAYTQTKSYSPVIRYPAEFLERNIGNPVAGTIGAVGRRTGVEGGLRWALQGRKRKASPERTEPIKGEDMDVENGLSSPTTSSRRISDSSEPLPAYDSNERSPPYHEQTQSDEERKVLIQSHQNQPPPGWQTRLMVTTSGLGVAMSEQSRKNLKYCLSWLRWANDRLATLIVAVAKVLKELEKGPEDSDQEKLTVRLQALSKDVADTVKKVVAEVSNYAGGALPQNARDLVHRYFNSLPHRWRYATTMADTNAETQSDNEAVSNGRRVLALAHEGLNMMTQVTIVVNDTLVSAENWCERLGRKSDQHDQRDRKRREPSQDVHMEDVKQ